LSLVVIIVLFYGREEDDVTQVAVRSGVGWAGTSSSVDKMVPVGATVVNMSDHGRFGGPRFAQLDDDYKVWAAYQRAQLKKEKLWKAVVTVRPASGSDDKKADPVVAEWDAMNEAAFASIHMSVKPVHLRTVTSANAASTRIAGEAELWHRRFNHLGIENFERAATMVDGMPSSVADAERVVGTVSVLCVDGKMVQAPHPRSSTKTTKCDLVHTDVGGTVTESLGRSIYFITALEDSTGFVTATPIQTKGMTSQVPKTRIKQLER